MNLPVCVLFQTANDFPGRLPICAPHRTNTELPPAGNYRLINTWHEEHGDERVGMKLSFIGHKSKLEWIDLQWRLHGSNDGSSFTLQSLWYGSQAGRDVRYLKYIGDNPDDPNSLILVDTLEEAQQWQASKVENKAGNRYLVWAKGRPDYYLSFGGKDVNIRHSKGALYCLLWSRGTYGDGVMEMV